MKNKLLGYRLCLFIFFFSCAIISFAQSETQLIRQGNKLYRAKKYVQAEIAFRKALGKNSRNAIATYNLGCALQAQKKVKEALKQYKAAASLDNNSVRRSKAYYNTGTIFQQQKKYEEAIKAYKNALRSNPNHDNARYNLELCKQQQKQQQNKQQKNTKNNKDKNKQQNKNKNNKNNQNKNDQMSKDNAERLLDAAMQQEKATQNRLSKAMRQPSDRQLEKNW